MTKKVLWGALAISSGVAMIWWSAWIMKVSDFSDWWAFPTLMTGVFALACATTLGIIKSID